MGRGVPGDRSAVDRQLPVGKDAAALDLGTVPRHGAVFQAHRGRIVGNVSYVDVADAAAPACGLVFRHRAARHRHRAPVPDSAAVFLLGLVAADGDI